MHEEIKQIFSLFYCRSTPHSASAPLLPFLKRFETIQCTKRRTSIVDDDDSCSSPTDCFLKFLTLPDDDTISVDLRQAAVFIMSHLDRLATPHIPKLTYLSVSTTNMIIFLRTNLH